MPSDYYNFHSAPLGLSYQVEPYDVIVVVALVILVRVIMAWAGGPAVPHASGIQQLRGLGGVALSLFAVTGLMNVVIHLPVSPETVILTAGLVVASRLSAWIARGY